MGEGVVGGRGCFRLSVSVLVFKSFVTEQRRAAPKRIREAKVRGAFVVWVLNHSLEDEELLSLRDRDLYLLKNVGCFFPTNEYKAKMGVFL